jgi:hypothetical protein
MNAMNQIGSEGISSAVPCARSSVHPEQIDESWNHQRPTRPRDSDQDADDRAHRQLQNYAPARSLPRRFPERFRSGHSKCFFSDWRFERIEGREGLPSLSATERNPLIDSFQHFGEGNHAFHIGGWKQTLGGIDYGGDVVGLVLDVLEFVDQLLKRSRLPRQLPVSEACPLLQPDNTHKWEPSSKTIPA